MRSRLVRRLGLSGSLLPADTTFTAAEGSTRAITARDEMPIFALTLHARMWWPAPTAMLSPTTAQNGIGAAALADVGRVSSSKMRPLRCYWIRVIVHSFCSCDFGEFQSRPSHAAMSERH